MSRFVNSWFRLFVAGFGTLCLVSSVSAGETVVNDATLSEIGDGSNWLAYGRNYSEQRYSPLDEINHQTIGRLGIDWVLDLPNDRSLLATPLVVDGVM